MPCYFPNSGWRSIAVGKNGKPGITFNRNLGFTDKPVVVGCGQCIGCRLDNAAEIGARCVHESMMHESSEYVTLTYADEHLPHDMSLRYSDVQLFWKRLRKKFPRFKYFVGGEYGPESGRPHYHAIIFGILFPDKKFYKKNKSGDPLYTSDILDSLWKLGFATIGEVTFASACYVAKYCVDKVNGDHAYNYYQYVDGDGVIHNRAPEFGRFSSKPGLGATFVAKYQDQLLRDGSILINGKEMAMPRYYDKLLEKIAPDRLEELKVSRRAAMRRLQAGDAKFATKYGPRRNEVRHEVAQAKLRRKDEL